MAGERPGARVRVLMDAVPEHLERWRRGDPDLAPLYAGFPPEETPRLPGKAATIAPSLFEGIALRSGGENAPEGARANLARINGKKTKFVAAGHQPCVLLGPLLALYKMLTLRAVVEKTPKPDGGGPVPLFWIASHDADRGEAEGATLIDAGGDARRLRAPFRDAPARARLGALRIDPAGWRSFLGEAAALLPPGPHKDDLFERLRAAVPEETGATDLFVRTARAFVPELPLLFLDGRDAESVPEGRRVLAAAARDPRGVHAAIEKGARLAAEAGLPILLPVEPDRPPFFLVEDETRIPLRFDGGRFHPEGGNPMEPAALAERIEEGTVRATPAAALRPVLQDAVLPVAAYAAGLSELIYHAALGPLYAALGVERAPLFPRAGFYLLPERIADRLENIGVTPEEILAGREKAPDPPELAGSAKRFRERIAEETAVFLGEADRLAPGAVPPDDPARNRVAREAERAADRVLRFADRAGDNRRNLIHRARSALLPGGKPQETVLSPIGPFARFGPGLADLLTGAIRPGDGAPRLVVPGGGGPIR
ncbi:MAG: bacillithiol biosynthesis BshC [Candidatus Eisenbacteria bacterium]|nr:bacillithiol biosynthesis BshC [Candidatus Eisenbacteria bacterium]